jgi:hypothetical protein
MLVSLKALITLSFCLAGCMVLAHPLPSVPSPEDAWLKASEAPENLVAAGGKVALSYSDCSGGKMHVKGVKVAFSPKQPSLGDTLTVTASGNLDEAITGGTYSFKAKKLGITLASHSDTVCGKTSFKVVGLPVSVKGVDCSNTKPGSIGISLGIGLPRVAPHVGLVVQVTGKDSNNGGLFCVNVNVKIEAATTVARSATAIGASKPQCTGAGTLPGDGPFCYQAKIGMLGVTETLALRVVRSKMESTSAVSPAFTVEKGTMDLIGSGVSPFKCTGVALTKNGQTVTPDMGALSHCLPRGVTLMSATYCSDTNAVQVSIKDKNIPVFGSITKVATAVKCPSTLSVEGPIVAAASSGLEAALMRIGQAMLQESGAVQCLKAKCASSFSACMGDSVCKSVVDCVSPCGKGDKSCALKCVKPHLFEAKVAALGACGGAKGCWAQAVRAA